MINPFLNSLDTRIDSMLESPMEEDVFESAADQRTLEEEDYHTLIDSVHALFIHQMENIEEDTSPKEYCFGPHARGVWRILPMGPYRIASASYDHQAGIWNVDPSNKEAPLILSAHRGEVLSLASPDSATLITGSSDGSMCLWNAQTGKLVSHFGEPKKRTTGFYSLALIGQATIATGACQKPRKVRKEWKHVIKVWNFHTCRQLCVLEGHAGGIAALNAFQPGFLASASADKAISIWNTTSYRLIHSLFGHKEYIYALTSLDSNCLVTGSKDRTIRLWDVSQGTEVGQFRMLNSMEAHASTIYDVAKFQEHLVLSASRDGYVKIWDSRTLKSVRTFSREGSFIYSVAPLAENRIAAGTCENGKKGQEKGEIIVWEL